jgi:adenosylcobinamide-GDP ribazoletransferase
LSALPPTPGGALAVALLVCASRAALLLVCRRGVPAARPDGLGRTVAGTVAPVAGGLAGLVAVAVVLLAAHLAGRPWPEGLVAAALALVAVAVLVAHVVRRLGGVSGDVMGTAVEVALTALLVGMSR